MGMEPFAMRPAHLRQHEPHDQRHGAGWRCDPLYLRRGRPPHWNRLQHLDNGIQLDGAFRLRLSKMENGELNLLQQSDNFKRPTELPIWLYDHFVLVQLHVALLRTAVHIIGSKRSRRFNRDYRLNITFFVTADAFRQQVSQMEPQVHITEAERCVTMQAI